MCLEGFEGIDPATAQGIQQIAGQANVLVDAGQDIPDC